MVKIYSIAILFLIDVAFSEKLSFNRIKRFIVPPTSPTRHQLISGIGIPLQLENEAITLGITMKAQYLLPDNGTYSLKPVYFPDIFTNYSSLNSANNQMSPFPSYYGKRRRRREVLVDDKTGQKYEKYDVDVKEVGNVELKDDEEFEDEYLGEFEDPKYYPEISDFPRPSDEKLADTSGTRWLMYDGLANLLTKQGFKNGRECVLKAICDAADVNFTHHSGLFGEIFHILFSPSASHDKIVKNEHLDYAEAEKIGSSGEDCEKVYRNCKDSIMDIFTKIYV